MKTSILVLLFSLIMGYQLQAQDQDPSDGHGGRLNLGVGIGGYSGYYGYEGNSLPVININYEIGILRNFTIAPFASFISYRQNYYHETVIPIGGKGTLYLDQALGAGRDWDFYLAGSVGFSVVKTTWDNGYYRDSNFHTVNPLFLDFHLGAEYHLSQKVGIFLDFSTGVSTLGLSF